MKALFSFGFSFFLRAIIPGVVGVFALSPLFCTIGFKLGINLSSSKTFLFNIGLLITVLALSIGFLLVFLDDIIYKIFEGLIFYPKFIRKWLTNRLNKKIKRKSQKAQRTDDEIEKKKLWRWLIMFPLKEEIEKTETEAVLPTKLGNILYSYESYPKSRYGIDAIFFWHRIWLAVDKETRKEINTIWSEADSVTYISFIFFIASVLNFLAFIFDLLNIPTLFLGLSVIR